MSDQPIPTPAPVEKIYEDEINMTELTALLGIKNAQYTRKLVTTGKVPSAKRNSKGFWKFSEAKVVEWLATRKTTGRASGPRQTADGRKLFKVRLNQDEVKALVDTGHVVEAGYKYNPEKSKAYRMEKAKAKAKVTAGNPAK